LHLFSAAPEQVKYGKEHYRIRSQDSSTLLYRLFEQYQKEGLNMPYTMEEFRRDFVKERLKDLTPEELAAIPVEKRLQGLSEEELLKKIPLEKRLEGFSDEEIAALLKRRRGGDSSSAPK
jgi:hypothetical protein